MNPAQLMQILASILYHIDDVQKEKKKLDDGQESAIVEHRVVEIVAQKDMVMCILPLQLLQYYEQHPYRMQFQIRKEAGTERHLAVIGFEKDKGQTGLVNTQGQAIATDTGVRKMFDEFFNPPAPKVDA